MTQKRIRAPPERPTTPPNHAGISSEMPSTSSILISPSIVQACLNEHEISASYAASQNLIQPVEFQTSKAADVLVIKGGGDSEFILRGVFQIARNDFYFHPDENFNPANSFGSCLQDIKLSCRLTLPVTPEFTFAQSDFNLCIENIHHLEKLIKHEKNSEIMSMLSEHLGKTQFKLCHALFEVSKIIYLHVHHQMHL